VKGPKITPRAGRRYNFADVTWPADQTACFARCEIAASRATDGTPVLDVIMIFNPAVRVRVPYEQLAAMHVSDALVERALAAFVAVPPCNGDAAPLEAAMRRALEAVLKGGRP
jgi:hypothetical protein